MWNLGEDIYRKIEKFDISIEEFLKDKAVTGNVRWEIMNFVIDGLKQIYTKTKN